MRIALLGNMPPRRCGIASFTRDVAAALRGAGHAVRVAAMTEPGGAHDYGEAADWEIREEVREDHRAAGRAIADWTPDALLVEHEFGIYGGPDGAWVLDLLDAANVPAAIRLHTVLETPTPGQARVMAGLRARAAAFTVMAHRGAAILGRTDGDARRPPVTVIPHGAPDRPLADPARLRARLGWPERPTLLTFGLLGPGKGIEMMIDALPGILRAVPHARYVLMGATHPALLAREGERYRDGLRARAEGLGVAHALHMENRFVADDELCDALRAAEVYVTPYPNPAQITSGTLSYALACGAPVLSTPYWHAAEALPPEMLVPFDDPGALADKAVVLLREPELRDAIAHRTWARHRGTVWAAHAERLGALLAEAARPATIAAE